MQDKIIIYTDGSCLGNPGKGGWAVLLIYKDNKKEITGNSKDTTNNIMELTAVIKGLEAIKDKDIKTELFTDSSYVKDGITKWIFNWKKNNWRTSAKKPVKNKELWIELDAIASQFKNLEWNWVKAHSVSVENNRVDLLARSAAGGV